MRPGVAWRVSLTVIAILVTETLVCGLAVAPPLGVLWGLTRWTASAAIVTQLAVIGFAIIPSYVLFALGLMAWSAVAMRVTRTRTPPRTEMRLVDFDWPLLAWARYMASIHVVRVFAGGIFRGSPVWTAYLRLNGARLGQRVYVNTTSISDHNLLDFGDDVVIGDNVHLSGHTVESGMVKTGTVHIGRRVTIGLGSVIDIDVEIGDGCQVGALSLVPKHSRLESGATYAGIPARRLN